MEAAGAAPVGGSVHEETRAKLLREPVFWAAMAAFAGTALGVIGLLRQATMGDSFYVAPTSVLIAQSAQLLGGALVAASSLGVVCVLWRVLRGAARRVVLFGVASLASLLAAYAVGLAFTVYWNTGDRLRGYAESPFLALEAAAFYTIAFLPPVALLCFAVASLAAREKSLGALLASLCLLIICGILWFWLFPPDLGTYTEPDPLTEALLLLSGWYPLGVSLPQAPLWVLLGVLFLRRARYHASGGTFRVQEKENLEAAQRLYKEGLGRGDTSVLDELVSEDFRDLRRGSRGRLAMERVFSALWKSYPDLSVEVEEQSAEGDLVTTRLVLSGTDRGGVMWYPPTGRRVTFSAEFADRFSNGELVEHSGETDTEDLLRQLGLEAGR